MTRLCVVSAIAAACLALLSGSALAATPVLIGTVGPAFKITLTAKGKKVTTLPAGTYKLVVHDRSTMHNFVLEGPGVARDVTSVPFEGTKTVTVKLRSGKVKYYCRPHESIMFGFVAVG